jgi:4a-hydroxytetrahydrobiopterin dehydratase
VRDPLLDPAELDERMGSLDGWAASFGKLHKEFEFADFSEAFGFMVRVALAAEKLDHHPDWSNSWNKVVVDIMSHEANGITARCIELATAIDRVSGSSSRG